MDETPEQSSPKHILNALNNDCIQECLRRLTNVHDFLSAAQVCKRFRANAIECYPKLFKKIIIHDWLHTAYPNGLPSEHVNILLNTFGHLIGSIDWTSVDSVYVDKRTRIARNQQNDQETLNTIADLCGNTLTKLKIQNHISNFKTRSSFKNLKKLTLNNAPPLNFALHEQLKCLKLIRNNNIDSGLMVHFPNLEKVTFFAMQNLTDSVMCDFFALNQQLKCLKISRCFEITTSIFKNIGNRLPNLQRLCFNAWNLSIDENMMGLGDLKQLKQLTILCKSDGLIEKLIRHLAENGVPIEELIFDSVCQDISDQLAKLKQIRRIKISDISNEMLINVAKKQIALEKFDVYSGEISFNAIKKTLEYGHRLTELVIDIENLDPFDIDLKLYESLLRLAVKRTHLNIKFLYGKIDVPKNIQNSNRKWINLKAINQCKMMNNL